MGLLPGSHPPFLTIDEVFDMRLRIANSFPPHFSIYRSLAAALLTLGIVANAWADVSVPNIFSDHMVLQRNQPNKIWGKAAVGEKVTVKFGDQSHTTTADAKGLWHVTLAPLGVGGSRTLEISGGKNVIRIVDVLVGEVWICSGQSNMAWKVASANDPDLEAMAANHPRIRMINFHQVGTQEPVWDHQGSSWMVCSPQTVANFSAVGYFFGRQLHETLDVPIGLINNAWGGSACEAWISRSELENAGKYSALIQRADETAAQYQTLNSKAEKSDEDRKQLEALKRQVTGNQRPANIYNGVLKSHMGYGIRGAIWYQGESNAGRAYQYRELFPLMISSWRKEWGQGDFPFYWVQLADYMQEQAEPQESSWAELREAQTMTMSRLKHTGEAVIIDIGEGKDIHPKNKVDVGRRLARLALDNDYGFELASRSPLYKSMEKSAGKIILTFEHIDNGWRPFDVAAPTGFAIAGADKKFVWAEGKIIEGNRLEISSPQVTEPVAVRYAWGDNPVCNMFDGAGLPLTPFRTDDWPGVTVDKE
jgi:sialate O-acetylesterase